jgi:hypothetical protein
LINQGTIYNYAEFVNAGILKNSGDLRNGLGYEDPPEYGLYKGDLEDSFISYSGRIFSYGQIDTSGRILNDDTFYNRGGTIVATGTDNCAFENRETGSLYMESGTISATGNASALCVNDSSWEHSIHLYDGKIVHQGSGGYALYLVNCYGLYLGENLETNNTVLSADTLLGLIGADGISSVLDIKCLDAEYETPSGTCERQENVSVISLGHYCFPYEESNAGNYVINLKLTL